MAETITKEQLQAELAAAQTELKAKDEEITSLKAEIEASVSEIKELQKALEKSEDESTDNNTVEVDGQTYRILHGGMGLEGFEKFNVKDIQSNGELAAELVKIGFGGLELVSND